jgi:hypothetical protein
VSEDGTAGVDADQDDVFGTAMGLEDLMGDPADDATYVVPGHHLGQCRSFPASLDRP